MGIIHTCKMVVCIYLLVKMAVVAAEIGIERRRDEKYAGNLVFKPAKGSLLF